MSDRMTVAEVVTELRMRSDAACRERDDWFSGQSDGHDEAADLVEQHLAPQPDALKSRDRQALETLVKSIMLNSRDAKQSTSRQLAFTVVNIRHMTEQIAKLTGIETQ